MNNRKWKDGDVILNVRVGDIVRMFWGGTAASGTQRTTVGTVVKITRSGRVKLSRHKMRDANGHVRDVCSILGRAPEGGSV